MSEQNKRINFHIMHSMKGGCGKSTCALFKALQLARGTLDGSAKVLFLDADFKGSAMQLLLFRNEQMATNASPQGLTSGAETFTEVLKKMSESPTEGNGLRHTIAIPDNYRPEDNLSRYLKGADVSYNTLVQKTFSYYADNAEMYSEEMTNSKMSMNGHIDFILSSADRESKDWFRNRYGKIGPGLFVYRMERLIEKILCHNATATKDSDISYKPLGQYKDVIIDMPPGYDEYSDMLLELLLRLATKEDRIKLHYYAVTTEDIGHKKLAYDNIQKVCTDGTEFKGFDTINAIINTPYSTKSGPGTQEKNDYDVRIKKQIDDLKELLGNKGRIYLNEYNGSYHKYCTMPEIFEFELEKTALRDTENWEKLEKNEDESEGNAEIL